MRPDRERERREVRSQFLTALRSTSGGGLSEAALRRLTGAGLSLFHEVMPELLAEQLVTVSQSDGRRNQTEYHLVPEAAQAVPQEGPLSPLAVTVLTRLKGRPEGARSLAKVMETDLSLIQAALDELEGCGEVSRSQVGMLVIYRVLEP